MNALILRTALLSFALIGNAAYAGTAGTASVNDVTLGGDPADAFVYANQVNPQGNAGSSGFSDAFAAYGTGPWYKIAKFTTSSNGAVVDSSEFGVDILTSFDQYTNKNGAWSVTNKDTDNLLKLDLVFAMHTGGGSGAWLFDDLMLNAGQTLDGTWVQKMLNNGGNIGAYSNMTVFARNFDIVPPFVVPEPATMGTMMLGLGLIGFMSRRRRKKQS